MEGGQKKKILWVVNLQLVEMKMKPERLKRAGLTWRNRGSYRFVWAGKLYCDRIWIKMLHVKN